MAADIILEQIGNDLPFEIDYVFPYVNNTDPAWQKDYEKTCKKFGLEYKKDDVRVRDYGTLQYVFRGIEKYIPWIRNIYMIVERDSQVPKWVNRDNVKIVYHSDIMPQEILPTYNSSTIEMFLHKIPGLSEYFIYGNDDMYTTNYLKKSDFFTESGLPKFNMTKVAFNDNNDNVYRHMLRNGNELAFNDAGKILGPKDFIYKGDHGIAPYRRSTCRYVIEKYYDYIIKICSTFRQFDNLNQDTYKSWQFVNGLYSPCETLSMTYMSIRRVKNEEKLFNTFLSSRTLCINDNELNDPTQYDKINRIIKNTLQKYYPNKCKYEK